MLTVFGLYQRKMYCFHSEGCRGSSVFTFHQEVYLRRYRLCKQMGGMSIFPIYLITHISSSHIFLYADSETYSDNNVFVAFLYIIKQSQIVHYHWMKIATTSVNKTMEI